MLANSSRARTTLDRVHSASRSLLTKFAKFGVVGAFAFVVDVGLFNVLSYWGASPVFAGQPLWAKFVSTSVATVVAWLGNRLWTFRKTKRSDVFREFVLYAVMCTIGLGIAMLCLWISHYALGFTSPVADNVAANVVGLVAGTLFRFWAYQRFVFIAPTSDIDPSDIDPSAIRPEDEADVGAGSPPRSSVWSDQA